MIKKKIVLQKGFRIDNRIIKKIDELSNVTGRSQNELAEKAFQMLFADNVPYFIESDVINELGDAEDGYKYTYGDVIKVNWKCPNCGNIIKNKTISDVFHYGLSCPICSDGILYPEKFMYNLLKQLGIDFEYQYSPKWANRKRYDFYIPSKQLIIEMDGGWHSQDNLLSGQTKDKSKEIDDYKNKLAEEHGIEPIRIDCDYHVYNADIIKQNILNSQLYIFIDFSHVDWLKIDSLSQKSLTKEICDYKKDNPLEFASDIASKYNLGTNTVVRYLKRGTRFGWCNYDPKAEFARNSKLIGIKHMRKIICITTNTIYSSQAYANKLTHITQGNISACCLHNYHSAGKLLDGTPLVWMYLEEYMKQNGYTDISQIPNVKVYKEENDIAS